MDAVLEVVEEVTVAEVKQAFESAATRFDELDRCVLREVVIMALSLDEINREKLLTELESKKAATV